MVFHSLKSSLTLRIKWSGYSLGAKQIIAAVRLQLHSQITPRSERSMYPFITFMIFRKFAGIICASIQMTAVSIRASISGLMYLVITEGSFGYARHASTTKTLYPACRDCFAGVDQAEIDLNASPERQCGFFGNT